MMVLKSPTTWYACLDHPRNEASIYCGNVDMLELCDISSTKSPNQFLLFNLFHLGPFFPKFCCC